MKTLLPYTSPQQEYFCLLSEMICTSPFDSTDNTEIIGIEEEILF